MSEFTPVAKVSDIPDPGQQLVEIDERLVVLFHVGQQFYAIDDICTHDGGPLGEGPLDGYAVACPRHGAKFDIRTGAALTMPATKPTVAHEVKIVGDDVLVRLNDGTPTSAEAEVPHAAPASASEAVAPDPAAVDPNDALRAQLSERASQSTTEDTIREALKQVIDPELFINIVDLGLIYGVEVETVDDKMNVKIDMTMTSPACPAGPQLISQSKTVVGAISGVGNVEVKLVMTPPWTPDLMTEDAKDQLGIF